MITLIMVHLSNATKKKTKETAKNPNENAVNAQNPEFALFAFVYSNFSLTLSSPKIECTFDFILSPSLS